MEGHIVYLGPHEPAVTILEGAGFRLSLDGEMYSGQLAAMDYNGRGRCVYPDNSTYDGTFKNGMRDGRGTFRWVDGGYYEGEYREDLKHGRGRVYAARSGVVSVLLDRHECIQEGFWSMGVFQGG